MNVSTCVYMDTDSHTAVIMICTVYSMTGIAIAALFPEGDIRTYVVKLQNMSYLLMAFKQN